MDFFKSILSEKDPDPQTSENPLINENPSSSSSPKWQKFNTLIRSLATQSESVIETCKRDLKEFGSGLQKETETFRSEIDTVLKDIISRQKTSSPDRENNPVSKKYSRYESQLRFIESDIDTYVKEPEDLEDFEKWKSGFVYKQENNEVIEWVYKKVVPDYVDDENFWLRYHYKVHKLKEQEDMRAKIVRRAISIDLAEEELSWDVDDDDDDENIETSEKNEVLGNVMDDDIKNEKPVKKDEVLASGSSDTIKNEKPVKKTEVLASGNSDNVKIEKPMMKNEVLASGVDNHVESEKPLKSDVLASGIAHKVETKESEKTEVSARGIKEDVGIKEPVGKNEVLVSGIDKKVDKKEVLNEKIVDVDSSCKDSDMSIKSTRPSLLEEDMGWDEIEDVGSGDEKKVPASSNEVDLKKRLSGVVNEEEDLSWDIEDDEEPVAKK